MTAADAPEILADDALDPEAERVARHVRILKELAEIGVRIAQSMDRQAELLAPSPAEAADGERTRAADAPVAASPPTRVGPGTDFGRLTRAIRLTLMLEIRIAEGETMRQAEVAEARVQRTRAVQQQAQADWVEARSEAVLDVIEATLEAKSEDDESILERLDEAREYLERGDEDFDLEGLPTGLVIARICRDMGLEPDWARWAQADWAVEEARDRPRGSPYAGVGGNGGEGASNEPAKADRGAPDEAPPRGGSP